MSEFITSIAASRTTTISLNDFFSLCADAEMKNDFVDDIVNEVEKHMKKYNVRYSHAHRYSNFNNGGWVKARDRFAHDIFESVNDELDMVACCSRHLSFYKSNVTLPECCQCGKPATIQVQREYTSSNGGIEIDVPVLNFYCSEDCKDA